MASQFKKRLFITDLNTTQTTKGKDDAQLIANYSLTPTSCPRGCTPSACEHRSRARLSRASWSGQGFMNETLRKSVFGLAIRSAQRDGPTVTGLSRWTSATTGSGQTASLTTTRGRSESQDQPVGTRCRGSRSANTALTLVPHR